MEPTCNLSMSEAGEPQSKRAEVGYQFREDNEENSQEKLQKAVPHTPIMELPPRAQGKKTTFVRTEELGLQNQDSEAAGGEREQRKVVTVPGTLLTKLKKKLTAPGTVPAKEKFAQVNPSAASFPHPTTKNRQRLKASNFMSEPRWDFEEEYSLDVGSLTTTCPDSLKIRASKSPWLQDIFLPDLILFLDSKHFTQMVQKVGTRFPPVSQQQLLLASLPAPPSPPPRKSRCITCAVVANGGILNNSHVGQEIDSRDYVVRLSEAITEGYEQDVGTRTSFDSFTAFSVVQLILTLGHRGFQHVPLGKDIRYLHFLEGTRDYEWLEAIFLNQTMAKTKLSWFRFLRSKTLDTAHWRIHRPTTSALLLLTALYLCYKVSAYGFITQGHERFSDHYYDKS